VFNILCFVVSIGQPFFCLVVPAVFATLYHLYLYVLCKLSDDDDDDMILDSFNNSQLCNSMHLLTH